MLEILFGIIGAIVFFRLVTSPSRKKIARPSSYVPVAIDGNGDIICSKKIDKKL